MQGSLRTIAIPFLFWLTSHAPAAQAEAIRDNRYEESIQAAEAILLERLKEHRLPGLSVAVGIRKEVIWAQGFGHADLENRIPVTASSKFRIGSVSKPLTAYGLARLMEQGKLDLDVPIQKYVPEFPLKKQGSITGRQLAGHLAGIRHYKGREFFLNRTYSSVRAGLEIFKNDPLLYEPGTQFSYSSYGWNLLSAAMETAAGNDFLQFMEQQVFTPLEMTATLADKNLPIISHRVRFYQRGLSGLSYNAPQVNNSYKWAGGGFLSTATDLVKFASEHFEPQLISAATVELLWKSQQLKNGQETGYGIGWRIRKDEQGRRIVSHSGGSVGGTTQLILYPEQQLVVALMVNLSQAPNFGHAKVCEAFLNQL